MCACVCVCSPVLKRFTMPPNLPIHPTTTTSNPLSPYSVSSSTQYPKLSGIRSTTQSKLAHCSKVSCSRGLRSSFRNCVVLPCGMCHTRTYTRYELLMLIVKSVCRPNRIRKQRIRVLSFVFLVPRPRLRSVCLVKYIYEKRNPIIELPSSWYNQKKTITYPCATLVCAMPEVDSKTTKRLLYSYVC